jgi:hypothetical protein
LSLQEIIPIRLNNTFLVIGKIEWVKLEGDFLCPDGFIDLQQAGSLCSNGTDSYYYTQAAGRYNYAKPGIPPQKIA